MCVCVCVRTGDLSYFRKPINSGRQLNVECACGRVRPGLSAALDLAQGFEYFRAFCFGTFCLWVRRRVRKQLHREEGASVYAFAHSGTPIVISLLIMKFH